VCALLTAAARPAYAQAVSQKGFVEVSGTGYAQRADDDATRVEGEVLGRYEVSVKPASWLSLIGGVDFRADGHDQANRSWRLDWDDRTTQRPMLSLRRLSATVTKGALTAEIGKQFIRWGKADVLNPTDRFAPRDYLSVVTNDFLAVSGVRTVVGLQSNSLDVVFVPRITPSRTPLADQRWATSVELPAGVQVTDGGRRWPEGPQYGARWNHVGSGFEYSLSGYRGFSHTPSLEAGAVIAIYPPPPVPIVRFYPRLWTMGGDFARPLSRFTVKGEAAFFGTDDERVDQYWVYVAQVERQAGEWFFVGGYAGEAVTRKREDVSFAPERGLTNAFIGKAGYTIDTNRSLAFEGAVRRTFEGSWLRAEYSQACGQHLRVTAQANWIRGSEDDFLGRYRRNSNLRLALRYSY
jgi:hypothetical protein